MFFTSIVPKSCIYLSIMTIRFILVCLWSSGKILSLLCYILYYCAESIPSMWHEQQCVLLFVPLTLPSSVRCKVNLKYPPCMLYSLSQGCQTAVLKGQSPPAPKNVSESTHMNLIIRSTGYHRTQLTTEKII